MSFRRAVCELRHTSLVLRLASQRVLCIPRAPQSWASYTPLRGLTASPQCRDATPSVVQAYADGGHSALQRALEQYGKDGFVPSPATLQELAPHIRNVKGLQHCEEILGVKADASTWITIIRNVAALAPHYKSALAAYQDFLTSGFSPSPKAFYPVLRALLTRRAPQRSVLKEAWSLYREYMLSLERYAERLPPEYTPQEDIGIYIALIRAFSNDPEFYPSLVNLLEDMDKRNIVLDDHSRKVIIPLFMAVAPDARAAYDAYTRLSTNADGKYVLHMLSFHSVLDVFCRKCITQAADVEYHLAMIQDNHIPSNWVGPVVYTQLLKVLGTLATKNTHDFAEHQAIATMIKRVHNRITLHPGLKADTMLWNHLMDAYQRAGALQQAYVIWESLYGSRTFDNTSVTIILDACSFAGATGLLVSVFAKLYKAGFPLNQKNWDTWIEALCRQGDVVTASKVLCVAIPALKRPDVQPRVEMARFIMQHAARLDDMADVRHRIKVHLPDVYAQL